MLPPRLVECIPSNPEGPRPEAERLRPETGHGAWMGTELTKGQDLQYLLQHWLLKRCRLMMAEGQGCAVDRRRLRWDSGHYQWEGLEAGVRTSQEKRFWG